MIIQEKVLRMYAAARGMRIKNAASSITLRTGDKFFLVRSATATYVSLDEELKPKFKLGEYALQKLETNSKKVAVRSKDPKLPDAEVEITKLKLAPRSKKPGIPLSVLKERIDKAITAPPYEIVLAPPAPFFTPRQLKKFWSTNKAKLQMGFRKSLLRVLEGRPDDSASKIEVKLTESSVNVQATISLPGDRYAMLRYNATANGKFLVIFASVSVESITKKPELVFRTPAVKAFFSEYLKMKPQLTKSFGLPDGATTGPFMMTSNVLTPYPARTRYFVTRV